MFEKIKYWYDKGLWTVAMLQNAVRKGVLTQEQYDEIVGGGDDA